MADVDVFQDALRFLQENALPIAWSIAQWSWTRLWTSLYLLLPTSPEGILPFLFSLLALYASLLALYRTASFALRASVFFLKYGIIVGAIALAAGWLLGGVTPTDLLPARSSGLGDRPKPWEPFAKHTEYNRRWKARYSFSGTVRGNNVNVDDARRIVDAVMQFVWDSAQRFTTETGFASAMGLGRGIDDAGAPHSRAGKSTAGKGTRSR